MAALLSWIYFSADCWETVHNYKTNIPKWFLVLPMPPQATSLSKATVLQLTCDLTGSTYIPERGKVKWNYY